MTDAVKIWPMSERVSSVEAAGSDEERDSAPGLTRGMAAGDEDAFARFYDRYSPRIYRHAMALTRGNEPEARELCHVVMVKLARRMKVFDEESALLAWLRRLTHNAYVDTVRERTRLEKIVALFKLAPLATDSGRSELPIMRALDSAMKELPAEDAELLHGVYNDKIPVADLSELHGQTYKAMESRLTRLRKRVKERLIALLRHEDPD